MALLTAEDCFEIYGPPPLVVRDARGHKIANVSACDPETGNVLAFSAYLRGSIVPDLPFFAPAPLTITPAQP